MPDTARSRTGLQASIGTDTINTIDDTLIAAFNKLETDMALDGQGVLSARPTSTVGSPGKRGRFYKATDTGQIFRDYGTGWDEIYCPPKRARVDGLVDFGIPDATETAVPFPHEIYDTDAIHDNVTSNSKLFCKTAGVYAVTAYVGWALSGVGSVGYRAAYIRKNGSDRIALDSKAAFVSPQGGPFHNLAAADVEMAVNDFVEVTVYQTQGTVQNLAAERNFSMIRISSL